MKYNKFLRRHTLHREVKQPQRLLVCRAGPGSPGRLCFPFLTMAAPTERRRAPKNDDPAGRVAQRGLCSPFR